MTTITIVPSDGFVYVDGEAQTVDMADMPNYIQAVQWYGAYGEVEFKTDENGKRLPNLRFTDFTPLQFMVTRWEESKQIADNQMTIMQQQQAARDAQLLAEQEARASQGTERLL
jgi:hypothetical protein